MQHPSLKNYLKFSLLSIKVSQKIVPFSQRKLIIYKNPSIDGACFNNIQIIYKVTSLCKIQFITFDCLLFLLCQCECQVLARMGFSSVFAQPSAKCRYWIVFCLCSTNVSAKCWYLIFFCLCSANVSVKCQYGVAFNSLAQGFIIGG